MARTRSERLAYYRKHNAKPCRKRANWFYGVRRRARRDGIPFNLEPEDLKIPKRCPVLGLPLRRSSGRAAPNSPSVDRIIPRKGYVRGNVIVVSQRANELKRDATAAELRKLAKFYSNIGRRNAGTRVRRGGQRLP
jgi:hypothetical protein